MDAICSTTIRYQIRRASEIWNVPLEWSLKAQLVFGQPQEGARENLSQKAMEPIEKRLFIHGA